METRLLSPGQGVLEKALDILFIPFVGLIVLARIQDLPAANIIIILFGAIYTTRNVLTAQERFSDLRLNWVDISTVVVMTSEIINYFASTYRVNTLSNLVDQIPQLCRR